MVRSSPALNRWISSYASCKIDPLCVISAAPLAMGVRPVSVGGCAVDASTRTLGTRTWKIEAFSHYLIVAIQSPHSHVVFFRQQIQFLQESLTAPYAARRPSTISCALVTMTRKPWRSVLVVISAWSMAREWPSIKSCSQSLPAYLPFVYSSRLVPGAWVYRHH